MRNKTSLNRSVRNKTRKDSLRKERQPRTARIKNRFTEESYIWKPDIREMILNSLWKIRTESWRS